MIKIEWDKADLAELRRDLRALRPRNLLRDDLRKLQRVIFGELRRYPPPRTNYRRTNHLKNSWQVELWDMDLKVENYASYAGYVQGEDQIDLHRRHGWRKATDIIKNETEKMLNIIEREIDRLWRN